MSDGSDHLKRANESTRSGLSGLLEGLYHYLLGFSEWTKNRHIIIQAGITGAIFVGIAQISNIVGSEIFTTFWGQAVYLSGVKLRLIPIPLSLLIYLLIFIIVLHVLSIKSTVRDLQSEIDELSAELEQVKNKDE